jgi:hypothetical protein
MSDGVIVISGEENVRAVGDMIRLRIWKSIAECKVRFGTTPPPGRTVSAFNVEYGVTCKNWSQVLDTLNDYYARRDAGREGK